MRIGTLEVSNRMVMGSMHTGWEEKKEGLPALAEFYRERVEGGVQLIVTGGIAPHWQGALRWRGATLSASTSLKPYLELTEAVHGAGGKIILQILHAGRYAGHPFLVAPSRIKAPINPFTPWALKESGIQKIIQHFVQCAQLAGEAGFDGIEIMGSEGYLLNQFTAPLTNHRTDTWGGSLEGRHRLPLEIVTQIRNRCGRNFPMIYRMSTLDLVEEGSTWNENIQLAKKLRDAGVDALTTGIGWHESRIPTIGMMVPHQAFAQVSARLKQEVPGIPIILSNRINKPEQAEAILAQEQADMISMARPFLADPHWIQKAITSEPINVCIACNQSCLDKIFNHEIASCLVNPRAGKEIQWKKTLPVIRGKIAIIGAGPAGLSAAATLAERGAEVHLFEKQAMAGGQFLLAKNIPGKEDYIHTIEYYLHQIKRYQGHLHFNTEVKVDDLQTQNFQHIIIAAGLSPRLPSIPGINHRMVCTYEDLLSGQRLPGKQIAIIGAGGIGFDVATYLMHPSGASTKAQYFSQWGIDAFGDARGGIKGGVWNSSERTIWLCQRKTTKPGASLGKTTGWAHKLMLKKSGVQFLSGVHYERIDDQGLHILIDGKKQCLPCDQIVLCAGQKSNQAGFPNDIKLNNTQIHLIGGSKSAAEQDAARSIEEGIQLGRSLG